MDPEGKIWKKNQILKDHIDNEILPFRQDQFGLCNIVQSMCSVGQEGAKEFEAINEKVRKKERNREGRQGGGGGQNRTESGRKEVLGYF